MKRSEQGASFPSETPQDAGTGDAGSADAVSTVNYTTATPPSLPQSRGCWLMSWLCCRACHRGYFTVGTLSPEPCPACAGGLLQPVALWDNRTDAAPPGMLRLSSDETLERLEAVIHGRDQPIEPQCPRYGDMAAAIDGLGRIGPLAAWRTGIVSGHGQVAAGFIEQDRVGGR